MRHGKKINHLGRTSAHREAMLANLASSLILHKRINTTLAKAKALRKYVEPLLTKSKTDSTHSRRTVFSYLQNKEAVTILFRDIAVKIAERPGGYTRILKTGNRLGDNAEMCFIELVDYNENMLGGATAKKAKATRRRGGAKKKGEATETIETTAVDVTDEASSEEAPKKARKKAAKPEEGAEDTSAE
jgi:large subunit ribosomal protein L17